MPEALAQTSSRPPDEVNRRLDRIESELERLANLVGHRGAPPAFCSGPWEYLAANYPSLRFHGDRGAEPSRSSSGTNVAREVPVPPWKHLVRRPRSWKRQLHIQGRNLSVRQLVGGVTVNQFTPEQAAENYGLPVEAIREALSYADTHKELLDLEAALERYLLAQEGHGSAAQPIP